MIGSDFAGHPALLQHRDPVAEMERLRQLVGDENQREAPVRKHPHPRAQFGGSGGRHHRRRLVKDQHAAVSQQRAGNLDLLLFAQRQLSRSRVQRNRQTIVRLQFRRPAPRSRHAAGAATTASPSTRFSNTLRVGTSIACWKTVLIPAARLAAGEVSRTRWPPTVRCPSSGSCNPANMPTMVDFPAPFSPSRTWISPARTDKDTSSIATTPGKRLVAWTRPSASVPFWGRRSSVRVGRYAHRRGLLGDGHKRADRFGIVDRLDLDLAVDDLFADRHDLVPGRRDRPAAS